MERRTNPKAAVVAGSVWETRMINDEIMGGFKICNEKNPDEESSERIQRVPKQSPMGKRKTWKSDNSVQIAVKKSPNSKIKEGSERNPVQIKKLKPKSTDLDDCRIIEKSPIEEIGSSERNPDEVSDGNVKTESLDISEESKSVSKRGFDDPKEAQVESMTEKLRLNRGVDEPIEEIEKKEAEIKKIGSDLGGKKGISNDLINVDNVKSAPKIDDLGLYSDKDEDIQIEKQSIEEIKSPEQKLRNILIEEKKLNLKKEKQLPLIVKKQSPNLINYSRTNPTPAKTKATPDIDGFQSQSNHHMNPHSHGKLQSLIDLVMWKDPSKSAFIFGIGTFIISSSSYTKDLNISLISVICYLSLVYLAMIFIFRSIVSRGDVDDTSENYVVGEEEAVWLLKMVLPYLNECLSKIKALFSGDPATTMKLAVLLFVLARCGGSITIWKMAKLSFFGMFTVPKICSSYSTHLTAYVKFWVRRFQDAWDSCSHKKAVAFGIFTLVWNLSSLVARIWAVFMLFVAFKYYQQSMVTDDNNCVMEEETKCEPSWQGHIAPGRRLRRAQINVVTTTSKEKKKF